MFGLEKLEVWQRALALADDVYAATEITRKLSSLRNKLLSGS